MIDTQETKWGIISGMDGQNGQAKIFIAWLDDELAERGWNDFQLARQAGLSHSVISKARSGILPKWEACEAIALALKLPVELVFRKAGLLNSETDDAGFEEMKHVLTLLPERDRYELLKFARLKLDIQDNRRNKTRRSFYDPNEPG